MISNNTYGCSHHEDLPLERNSGVETLTDLGFHRVDVVIQEQAGSLAELVARAQAEDHAVAPEFGAAGLETRGGQIEERGVDIVMIVAKLVGVEQARVGAELLGCGVAALQAEVGLGADIVVAVHGQVAQTALRIREQLWTGYKYYL